MKNRDTIYVVMRSLFDGNSVACAVCQHLEDAQELEARYEQQWLDKGFDKEQFYFYVEATTFYNAV